MQKRITEKSSIESISPYVGPVSRDDNEISLIDLWLVVRRHWLWILAGLLLGVAAAITYVALTTPIYESGASIQIGKVSDTGPIENLGALSVRLMDEYGPDSGEGPQRRMPNLKEATEEPRRNGIMRLVAVAYSPIEARDFLTQIVAKLLQQHEQIYASTVDPLRQRLATLDAQTELMTAQAAELGNLVTSLKNSQPAQAALVAIERSRLYVELNRLERERVNLQQQTTQPYSLPTRVVVRPSLPHAAVAPRKAIGLAIGMVLGLVLGLLVAFGNEFFTNMRSVNRSDVR